MFCIKWSIFESAVKILLLSAKSRGYGLDTRCIPLTYLVKIEVLAQVPVEHR